MRYFKNFSTVNYDIYGDGKTRTITDLFRKIRIDPKFLDDITFYTYYIIKNGERPDIVSYRLYGKIDYHWTFGLLNPWLLDVRRDWPMNNVELEDFVFAKYNKDIIMISDVALATKYKVGETVQGLASGATATIISKDPNLGYLVVKKTNSRAFTSGELLLGQMSGDYLALQSERKEYNAPHHFELSDGSVVDRCKVGAHPITNFEYEIQKNENNTKIKVIRPELVQIVSEKFIDTIKK